MPRARVKASLPLLSLEEQRLLTLALHWLPCTLALRLLPYMLELRLQLCTLALLLLP